jgi:hypothetical protein
MLPSIKKGPLGIYSTVYKISPFQVESMEKKIENKQISKSFIWLETGLERRFSLY